MKENYYLMKVQSYVNFPGLYFKKATSHCLCFIILACMLAGCAQEPEDIKTVISILYFNECGNLEKLVEDTYSDIDLQFERLSYPSEQMRRLEKGMGPELVVFTQPSDEISEKYLLDISDTQASTAYDGTVMQQLQVDGITYFLPLPGQYSGYIVNETFFRKAGIPLPISNQELLEAVGKMKELGIGVGEDGINFSISSATNAELGTYYAGYMVPDFLGTVDGVDWLAAFRRKEATFTGTWESMLTLTDQMVEAGLLDTAAMGRKRNLIRDAQRMADGTLAVSFGNSSLYQECRELNQTYVQDGIAPEYSYRMLPLLSDEGNENWLLLAPSAYVAVNAAVNEEKQEAAKRVLELISTSEGQEAVMNVETLIMAVVISMIIIWLFFGDIKASLIVGSSIPVSILAAFILMDLMGFSLNVITMSALTLGVGMMVDNSIVVLESCFRATASSEKKAGLVEFMDNALEGTRVVGASVLGGTATTCVVFIPLAFLEGMTGQLFKPLGFTIVFCLTASLISAVTVVPLCYMIYRPRERQKAPLSKPVYRLQDTYRSAMRVILPKKKTVMFISIGLLMFSLFLATKLDMELMGSDDNGEITISVDTRPGLMTEKADEILREIEGIIVQDSNLESYMTSYGGGGIRADDSATINAYLKDDRDMDTVDVVKMWKKQLADVRNCDISVEMSSSMSMMSSALESYEVILKGADYDEVKSISNKIVSQLMERDDVTKIHSDLENSSPVVEIRVDALKAQAAGLSASKIGSAVHNAISGVESTEIEIDGNDIDVKVEYSDEDYKTIDQVKGLVLTTGSGGSVALTDVADVQFVDSPASISREDKEYKVTISGEYTELATRETKMRINQEVVTPNLTPSVSIGLNSIDSSMNEEFSALYKAIGTAVFLIFVVMAAQFESPRYSFMVMTTIPFSLIGAFGLLFLTNCKISMVSLIGFLMLIGTVVNNGILFVDTANQYRETMDMDTALIEAGATRIRPILMTTLTTIISMIPMAMAIGNSGNMTQGLAIVNIGGLTASTVMCLLMLPGYYKLMSGNRKIIKEKRGGGRKPWPVNAGSFKKNLKRNRKDKGRSEE